jgi:superoxide dismutase, Fe-Mn family
LPIRRVTGASSISGPPITRRLAGGRPVLVLGMYEHAYHMDYRAVAARYVDVFMEAIRWDHPVKLYESSSRES